MENMSPDFSKISLPALPKTPEGAKNAELAETSLSATADKAVTNPKETLSKTGSEKSGKPGKTASIISHKEGSLPKINNPSVAKEFDQAIKNLPQLPQIPSSQPRKDSNSKNKEMTPQPKTNQEITVENPLSKSNIDNSTMGRKESHTEANPKSQIEKNEEGASAKLETKQSNRKISLGGVISRRFSGSEGTARKRSASLNETFAAQKVEVEAGKQNKFGRVRAFTDTALSLIGIGKNATKADVYSAEQVISQICNPQGNKHLGALKMDILNVSKDFNDIEKRLEDEIPKLNTAQQAQAKERLSELKEMVQYAEVLKNDSFKPDIINKLVNYRLGLKEMDIPFPDKLTFDPQTQKLIDSEGKNYDHLRSRTPREITENQGTPGAAERYEEFCRMQGGCPEFMDRWYEMQARDSNSETSCVVKDSLMNFREVPPEKYFLGLMSSKPKNFEKFKNGLILKNWQTGEKIDMKQYKKQDIDNTLLMFMAFNMEVLTHTDFPGRNSDNTVTIYRTEDKKTLDLYGIKEISQEKEHEMRRGPAESGSIIRPCTVYGNQITEQQVPMHRIFGTYLTQEITQYENEFVCQFEGIKFKYTGQTEKKAMTFDPDLLKKAGFKKS